MLGLSVYLSEPVKNQENYIKKMSQHGFNSIFTSLHIPEDDHKKYKQELRHLGRIAQNFNMELIADISPNSLKHLGCTWETADTLLSWGVTGLRIDYGVGNQQIASLSQKMKISLNASTLTTESLAKLKSHGLNTSAVEAWHNFYPRPETGLSRASFRTKNKMIQDEGISVMSFIPGDQKRRGPLFAGLPTLEDHRFSSPFAAYLDLKENEKIGKILLGDSEMSDSSLKQFSAYNDGIVLLRAKAITEDLNLLNSVSSHQTNRPDEARDVIRSMESRLYALIGTNRVIPENTVQRPIGSITVDNELYGRYQGEVQITKTTLQADTKVNVVGRIIDEDLPLLSHVKGGQTFKIEWI